MNTETESYKLDEKDTRILRALQNDARLTNKELAAKIHLSTTPTYERVKRLEHLGFIKQYATILNADKLNKGFAVFCSIKLRQINSDSAREFTNMIKEIPEVTECYNTSGDYDYMIKIYLRDMEHYHDFVYNTLGVIDSIGSLHSVFVIAEEKTDTGIPVALPAK